MLAAVAKTANQPRNLISLAAVMAIVTSWLLVFTSPASATHGCGNVDYFHMHWERPSDPGTITYRHHPDIWYDQGEDYATPVDAAASNWNSEQSYIDFDKITSGTPDTWVAVDDDPNEPAWGFIASSPDPCYVTSDTHTEWADVWLNSDSIEYSIDVNGRPTTLRQKVPAHEMGHSLGLAHPSVSTSTEAIMHQSWQGYYTVKPRDVTVLGWSPLYGHLD
ncbi:MAG: matrixin family metalloprotease [Chloroflexi bacterium]|nr:matrixin family metalloprotease [Chloroflexota bacterium]